MKILLKQGNIYNGTGSKPYIGDILIENNKITDVGNDIPEEKLNHVDKTIDISGLSVSSGFIDAHSHNDWFAIKKEPVKYFEPFIRQGITTFITGNCGLSSTGFEYDSPFIDKIGGGLFSFKDTIGKFGSMADFFNAIDNNNPCNIAALVGHCSVRAGIMGSENRPMNKLEEEKMFSMFEKSLKEGACGISLGLMYEPGLYASTEELKKVASICEKYNKPLTVHARAYSKISMSYKNLLGRSHILRALDELIEISKGMKLKLQYSHAIFVGRNSFNDKDELVEIIHNMRKNGVDAQFDIFSETLGTSVITVILPAWYQALSKKEKMKYSTAIKLKLLINATSKLLGFTFDDIQIAYIGKGYEKFEGKTVHQIANEIGKSDFNTYLELCEASNFKGRVNMGPYSTAKIISSLSKDDYCLYMTDAWVEDFGTQNPAIYDCFPKFLKFSLQGTGDTMPRTIRKMTGAVADRFGITDRGYIKPGYYADLTIFNEEELKYGMPDQQNSFGIKKVFINGKLILDDKSLDKVTLRTSGSAIRIK